ncbi:MAG TPA: hypothetical protein ENK85_09890 [Saprospiraceae bacterium]|nr:hypothetical protein [Saprospiraceae bacterium]
MKKFLFVLFVALLGTLSIQAQNWKPYTIGAETSGTVSDVTGKTKAALESGGFEVLGIYTPAQDANRRVIAITSPKLKAAVKKVGGLTGFAAALRVAVTKEGGQIVISYTTPEYWGNAYFQKKYGLVSGNYSAISSQLKSALSSLGSGGGRQFGSAKGLSATKLRKYHYMLGMPYFQDNHLLKSFSSYAEAVAKIETNLAQGGSRLKKVYAVEIPGKNIKLYGIALGGSKGEAAFLPIIDKATPKHTAFLPYEILVSGNKVYMLHGRYRIALSFPDLSMGTFTKIMSTPKDIKNMMMKLVQ